MTGEQHDGSLQSGCPLDPLGRRQGSCQQAAQDITSSAAYGPAIIWGLAELRGGGGGVTKDLRGLHLL